MKSKNTPYLPNERDYLEPLHKEIRSYSEKDYVVLPHPAVDPIVSNNIACMEFDYTVNDLKETDYF